MDSLILERLNEMANTLREIKLENAELRKAMFGIETSASSSSNSKSMSELGSTSLLELVLDTRTRVKALNRKIFNDEEREGEAKISKSKRGVKRTGSTIVSSDSESWDKPANKKQVLQTPSIQLKEQRKKMKGDLQELLKTKKTDDGKSLIGKTVEWVSWSITFSEDVKSSTTLKLSNHLDSDLTDPQNYIGFYSSPSNSGPTRVRGNFTEVFNFLGKRDRCEMLCSFAIQRDLRLAIYSANQASFCSLGIGFIPGDASTDHTLIHTLLEMPTVPEVSLNFSVDDEPNQVFIRSGNLLARGHMTNGPRSIVHVEVVETTEEKPSEHSLQLNATDNSDETDFSPANSPEGDEFSRLLKIARDLLNTA